MVTIDLDANPYHLSRLNWRHEGPELEEDLSLGESRIALALVLMAKGQAIKQGVVC